MDATVRSALGLFFTCTAFAGLARGQAVDAAAKEPVLEVDLLDNGFAPVRGPSDADDERAHRVPWWTSPPGEQSGTVEIDGERWLTTRGAQVLCQPIAAFQPLASGLRIRGVVAGAGLLVLRDGAGGRGVVEVGSPGASEAVEFEKGAADFERQLGRALAPRLTLELRAQGADQVARWSKLQVLVPLPCPSEAALRTEIVGEIDRIVRIWSERGLDTLGPRATHFACRGFDPVTGATVVIGTGGLSPLYEDLLRACAVERNDAWQSALAGFLDDFFELSFFPDTGLPRDWDCELDLPQDNKPVEVGRYLTFLLDVSERGPERFRARALEAARKLAAAVIAKGLLPDRSIAAKYMPDNGSPRLDVASIRYLDVAAPLARLGVVTADPRLVAAARSAVEQLEYTHFLGGTWKSIDPDFDDSFGHWGARCVRMLESHPSEAIFRRFVSHGFEHFAPLWEDALAFGGSIAADQARCWDLLLDFARLEPKIAPRLREDLRAALRAHFKSEQYDNGAWGDITFFDFSPRAGLDVGDFSGYPSNLMWGLAFSYARDSGLRSDELRAMFTAVLRSSRTAYRRDFGWLRTRAALDGVNPAGGDLRALLGLAEMLQQL